MPNSEKIILVTGGSGLVGQGIRLALENHGLKEPNERWIFASSKDLNLCDPKQTFAFFEQVRPTHVIHLAAKVGGLFANMSDSLGFFVSSTFITQLYDGYNLFNKFYSLVVLSYVCSCNHFIFSGS